MSFDCLVTHSYSLPPPPGFGPPHFQAHTGFRSGLSSPLLPWTRPRALHLTTRSHLQFTLVPFLTGRHFSQSLCLSQVQRPDFPLLEILCLIPDSTRFAVHVFTCIVFIPLILSFSRIPRRPPSFRRRL